jgi:hypothetical protein
VYRDRKAVEKKAGRAVPGVPCSFSGSGRRSRGSLCGSESMKRRALQLTCFAASLAIAAPALPHDCRVLGNGYLRGSYEGDCEEKNELAHGHGEAKGADSYVGTFVKGRPDGKGTYTWENGARLEGTFKGGKANGPGVYVAANGVRYEGPFENGKLTPLKPADCPATQGPLEC